MQQIFNQSFAHQATWALTLTGYKLEKSDCDQEGNEEGQDEVSEKSIQDSDIN